MWGKASAGIEVLESTVLAGYPGCCSRESQEQFPVIVQLDPALSLHILATLPLLLGVCAGRGAMLGFEPSLSHARLSTQLLVQAQLLGAPIVHAREMTPRTAAETQVASLYQMAPGGLLGVTP